MQNPGLKRWLEVGMAVMERSARQGEEASLGAGRAQDKSCRRTPKPCELDLATTRRALGTLLGAVRVVEA